MGFALVRFIGKLIITLALLAGVGYSQNTSTKTYLFERIPNELGLSQNYIWALCQDREGFIWAGTRDGLNRFDGYRFKTFTHEPKDPASLSYNDILTLFVDSKGRLWVGTAKGLNVYDHKTETFVRLNAENAQLNKQAFCEITEDEYGNIWAGTLLGKVYRLKFDTEKNDIKWVAIQLQTVGEEMTNPEFLSLVAEPGGALWAMQMERIFLVTSNDEQLKATRLDWHTVLEPQWIPKRLDEYPVKDGVDNILSPRVYALQKGKRNHIWLRTLDGVGIWDTNRQRFDFKPFNFDRSDYSNSPVAGTGDILHEDRSGKLWFGGAFALVHFDPTSGQFLYRHKQDRNTGETFFFSNIRSFMEDASGNFWAGSGGKGLYKYAPLTKRFNTPIGLEKTKGKSIRDIYETRDSVLWFSDMYMQLYVWDRTKKTAAKRILNQTRVGAIRKSSFSYILSMAEDEEGNFWLASDHMGSNTEIYKLIRDRGQIKEQILYAYPATFASIFDLYFDEKQVLWCISNQIFGHINQQTGKVEGKSYYKDPNQTPNRSGTPVILPSGPGKFWLGTADGLKHYSLAEDRFTHFVNEPNNPKSLSNNMVKTICRDPNRPSEVLWLGTGGGGLNRFDISSKSFRQYTTKDGLADNVVYGILPDEEGKLWLSTNRGLSKFDPQTARFENYTKDDGLLDDEFNSCAYVKSLTGDLVFGGIEGINLFSPQNIKGSTFKSPIVITDFQVANKSITQGSPDARLKRSILATDTIVLSYLDKVFSIEFASLDFSKPKQNQFAYMLEPFNKDWQEIGNLRRTTFTNIDPGKYVFRVKGTNASGVWNEEGRRMLIIIQPPWWQTWWAYLLFAAAGLGLVFALYRFQLGRQIDRSEAVRLAELDAMRSRLYTNITHEFRTPLTVILGMADQLKEGNEAKNIIQRNGESLLQLVNQLLDLSKVESGQLAVQFKQRDIIPYLNYLTESFFSIAKSKGIRLVFYSPLSEFVMDFDEKKIQHIVNNLISNALKFTPAGGKVVFHADEKKIQGNSFLELTFSDTGTGIPAAKIPYIFDRFFQADDSTTRRGEGTGIGLSLTKELVQLMQGEIQVKSEEGKGSAFVIHLPVNRNAEIRNDVEIKAQTGSSSIANEEYPSVPNGISGQPILLIVEDNADVRNYIRQVVQGRFQVLLAVNGKQGLELALAETPDLIISDVMMPEMDGFELSHRLKYDERTSHIPVVLLTAKATEEAKIDGLKAGADAYLVKPFNKEELLVRLEQLLALRQRLQHYYTNSPFPITNSRPVAEMSVEDLFIQKLQLAVQDRLDDPELNRDALAQIVNLSSSQLSRKLKALTELTPSLFIRKIRLQKSLELLQDEQLNIAEVAYSLGFNDPNYFTRVFREEFGKAPGDFRK